MEPFGNFAELADRLRDRYPRRRSRALPAAHDIGIRECLPACGTGRRNSKRGGSLGALKAVVLEGELHGHQRHRSPAPGYRAVAAVGGPLRTHRPLIHRAGGSGAALWRNPSRRRIGSPTTISGVSDRPDLGGRRGPCGRGAGGKDGASMNDAYWIARTACLSDAIASLRHHHRAGEGGGPQGGGLAPPAPPTSAACSGGAGGSPAFSLDAGKGATLQGLRCRDGRLAGGGGRGAQRRNGDGGDRGDLGHVLALPELKGQGGGHGLRALLALYPVMTHLGRSAAVSS